MAVLVFHNNHSYMHGACNVHILSLSCYLQGIIEFSLALFFAKLVAYTFLFWLPYYVRFHSKLYNIILLTLSILLQLILSTKHRQSSVVCTLPLCM